MVSDKVKNKVASLYKQCLEAYKRYRKGSQIVLGDSIPVPNPFDDAYTVPAELLFIELCKINKKWQEDRTGFNERLLTWLFQSRDFDLDEFSKTKKCQGYHPKNQYEVFFEVLLRKRQKTMPPFRGTLNMNEVTFQWCKPQSLREADRLYTAAEIKRRQISRVQYLSNTIDQYQQFRKYPKLRSEESRDIYYIRAIVCAESHFQAATVALKEFGIVSDCLNVAYGIGKYSIALTPGQDDKTPEERIIMCDTGICLVQDRYKVVARYRLESSSAILPTLYSPESTKNKLFRKLLQCTKMDSVIDLRIRNVIRELALAFSTHDRGLMYLAYWRCLEHSTRKADGNTRKGSEILKIFQNYYPHMYWRQMGKFVETLRNKYAHDGVIVDNGCSKQYLNWSQKYAECALYILLYLKKNEEYWSTNARIDKFFDYYIELDESLEVAQALLRDRHRARRS